MPGTSNEKGSPEGEPLYGRLAAGVVWLREWDSNPRSSGYEPDKMAASLSRILDEADSASRY